jgi:hypothetical protein
MALPEEIKLELGKRLDPGGVQEREGLGGRSLSYLAARPRTPSRASPRSAASPSRRTRAEHGRRPRSSVPTPMAERPEPPSTTAASTV